jgi:hypothetical protein
MSQVQVNDERLDSWKEIAAYLGRDLRTVRRWEEKGLPVRRVPGGERRAVFAYRREIDAWMAGQEESSTAEPRLEVVPSVAGHGVPTPVANRSWFSIERSGTSLALVVFTAMAVVTVAVVGHFRNNSGGEGVPKIGSVSAILPAARQRIVIRGRGFGLHTPYEDTDSPFLAVRDNTHDWAAGRIVPQNYDDVKVDVELWDDGEIVISGFSGKYGQNGWELRPGDQVEIAVWNPQTGNGPALFHLQVSHEMD